MYLFSQGKNKRDLVEININMTNFNNTCSYTYKNLQLLQ